MLFCCRSSLIAASCGPETVQPIATLMGISLWGTSLGSGQCSTRVMPRQRQSYASSSVGTRRRGVVDIRPLAAELRGPNRYNVVPRRAHAGRQGRIPYLDGYCKDGGESFHPDPSLSGRTYSRQIRHRPGESCSRHANMGRRIRSKGHDDGSSKSGKEDVSPQSAQGETDVLCFCFGRCTAARVCSPVAR